MNKTKYHIFVVEFWYSNGTSERDIRGRLAGHETLNRDDAKIELYKSLYEMINHNIRWRIWDDKEMKKNKVPLISTWDQDGLLEKIQKRINEVGNEK